jgi:hypothetical protein
MRLATDALHAAWSVPFGEQLSSDLPALCWPEDRPASKDVKVRRFHSIRGQGETDVWVRT